MLHVLLLLLCTTCVTPMCVPPVLLKQAFAFAVALPTTIAVVMLLVWHIRMVASNKTTIEHAEVRHCGRHCSASVFLLHLQSCAAHTPMMLCGS
jgi:hypothetical protein